MVSLISLISF